MDRVIAGMLRKIYEPNVRETLMSLGVGEGSSSYMTPEGTADFSAPFAKDLRYREPKALMDYVLGTLTGDLDHVLIAENGKVERLTIEGKKGRTKVKLKDVESMLNAIKGYSESDSIVPIEGILPKEIVPLLEKEGVRKLLGSPIMWGKDKDADMKAVEVIYDAADRLIRTRYAHVDDDGKLTLLKMLTMNDAANAHAVLENHHAYFEDFRHTKLAEKLAGAIDDAMQQLPGKIAAKGLGKEYIDKAIQRLQLQDMSQLSANYKNLIIGHQLGVLRDYVKTYGISAPALEELEKEYQSLDTTKMPKPVVNERKNMETEAALRSLEDYTLERLNYEKQRIVGQGQVSRHGITYRVSDHPLNIALQSAIHDMSFVASNGEEAHRPGKAERLRGILNAGMEALSEGSVIGKTEKKRREMEALTLMLTEGAELRYPGRTKSKIFYRLPRQLLEMHFSRELEGLKSSKSLEDRKAAIELDGAYKTIVSDYMSTDEGMQLKHLLYLSDTIGRMANAFPADQPAKKKGLYELSYLLGSVANLFQPDEVAGKINAARKEILGKGSIPMFSENYMVGGIPSLNVIGNGLYALSFEGGIKMTPKSTIGVAKRVLGEIEYLLSSKKSHRGEKKRKVKSRVVSRENEEERAKQLALALIYGHGVRLEEPGRRKGRVSYALPFMDSASNRQLMPSVLEMAYKEVVKLKSSGDGKKKELGKKLEEAYNDVMIDYQNYSARLRGLIAPADFEDGASYRSAELFLHLFDMALDRAVLKGYGKLIEVYPSMEEPSGDIPIPETIEFKNGLKLGLMNALRNQETKGNKESLDRLVRVMDDAQYALEEGTRKLEKKLGMKYEEALGKIEDIKKAYRKDADAKKAVDSIDELFLPLSSKKSGFSDDHRFIALAYVLE